MVEQSSPCENSPSAVRNELTPVAPLVASSLLRFHEIKPEQKHYLLKCTRGIFNGKFLFINTTPEGEVFGSGDPEQNEDITMYIESADLSLRHASIKYQLPKTCVPSNQDPFL